MKRKRTKNSVAEFEKAFKATQKGKYVLRLYIAGMTTKSRRAIQSIKKICEEHLKDQYELEIVDVFRQPLLAIGEEIIATPTLLKKFPLPLRKVIGDMTEEKRVLLCLDLRSKH